MKKSIVTAILVACTFLAYAQVTPLTQEEFASLAQLPPMGWNSWNRFQRDINEKVVMDAADAMVTSGMKDAGYEYICIDDCWQIDRDADGNILCDPVAFPHGMKYVVDYVHSKGLKFGIYSCAGSRTCAGRPGSQGYEFQDARFYASIGVDFLKYDFCNNNGADARTSYFIMREAIKAAGRPMVFNICEWGSHKPWEWGRGIGHSWRATGDIIDQWSGHETWGGNGLVDIVDLMKPLYPYAGPGHWNDADMLEIGNGGLNYDEQVSHFSLWCMFASPLIAGNDLTDMSLEVRNILTNTEAIAINQDPLGVQAHVALEMKDREVWVKKLSGGDWAVCFFNRSESAWNLSFNLSDLHELRGIGSDFMVRDLWLHKDLGRSDRPVTGQIAPHGSKLVRLSRVAGQKMAELTDTFSDYEVQKNGTGWAYWFIPVNGVGDTLSVKMSYVDQGTQTHTPHKHNDDELFVLIEGQATVTLNGVEQRLNAGDAFYAPSGAYHNIMRVTSRFPIKYVMFKQETTGPIRVPYKVAKENVTMEDCYVAYTGEDQWYLDPAFTCNQLNAKVRHVNDNAVRTWKGTSDQVVYFIVEGQAKVTVDGQSTILEALSSCYCPAGSKHSIQKVGSRPLRYIEVSTSY